MPVVVLVSLLDQKYSSLELVKPTMKHLSYDLHLTVGPIGLVSMLAAKAMGADTIIMTGSFYLARLERSICFYST